MENFLLKTIIFTLIITGNLCKTTSQNAISYPAVWTELTTINTDENVITETPASPPAKNVTEGSEIGELTKESTSPIINVKTVSLTSSTKDITMEPSAGASSSSTKNVATETPAVPLSSRKDVTTEPSAAASSSAKDVTRDASAASSSYAKDFNRDTSAASSSAKDVTRDTSAASSSAKDVTRDTSAASSSAKDVTIDTSAESSSAKDVTMDTSAAAITSSTQDFTTESSAAPPAKDVPTELPITTTTTNAPITTMAPLPSVHNYYNLTDGDVVCLMFVGEFRLSVTYNIGGNKTNQTVLSLPKHTDTGVDVTGNCNKKNYQWIKVSWGNGYPKTSLKLIFNSLNNATSWTLATLEAVIPLDNSTFINATDLGKSLNAVFNMTGLLFTSAYNQSYQCYAEITNKNGSVFMERQTYPYPVTATMKAVKMKAFNEVANVDSFVHVTHCSEDKIADLVPIGVGCALVALIIFVLLAYAIGRRRRSLSYQSV